MEHPISESKTHSRYARSAPVVALGLLAFALIAQFAAHATVTRAAASSPVESQRTMNFEQDITPLLSRYGCNSAGCHGKAEGQNGFKLSVFGYDPQADYDALVKQCRGRRVSPALPDHSLVLMKASGRVPHGGGVRLVQGTPQYETLRRWIAEGLPFGKPTDPVVERISVDPVQEIMALESTRQLRVTARYSDGHDVDVTRLAQFQTNNETLAKVDDGGLVSIGDVPGQAAIMARFMGQMAVFRPLIPRSQKIERYPDQPEFNFVDKLVDEQLKSLNIIPSKVADDVEFVRRVYLDVIGTLPTSPEVRRFLADPRSDRRAKLVDELLARPEYADYWAMKWSDLLRVDRQTLGYRDAFDYYQWIHDSLAANKPVDQMCRELLTVDGPISENGQAAFYKAIARRGDVAATVSQVFLGVRIACAECHHHPFDQWSTTDYYGMSAFFQNVSFKKEADGEALAVDGAALAQNPRTKKVIFAHPLLSPMPEKAAVTDQRPVLAAWITSPQNPWFARNMANRIVAHFLGRGLVEPVDDIRATNPPSNPALLDALAKELVDDKFDMKKLIRVIAASRVYQSSSKPNATNEQDEQNYSRALFKRLPAEVLLDAISQTTGIGEKFSGVPSGERAIQLWDSDVHHYFLKLFGRPIRKTACECERNVGASVSQILHLMNGSEIQAKLSHESGTVAKLVRTIPDNGKLVDELYLTFLSRPPLPDERIYAIEYISRQPDRRKAVEDLAWSLLNTLEFVFNH
ncbi:MAG TPA: DUF1549 and DUF1553 domain-containing protein [Humisphaera sp.]|nr:DUF1549 and DUF1553 domain-containing protein [Humisphaera sp.]